jgi:flagellar biosynthetic protein FlhB
MAEENEGASKTEEPTPRKLQQAREKGDVVKTPDLPAVASLAAAASVLILCGGWMSRNLVNALTPFLAHAASMHLEGTAGIDVARQAMMASAPILLAVMLAATAAGVAGNVLQTGLMLTPDKLKPDFSKVSPMAGLKRMFGLDSLMNFLKSLLKVAAVGFIGWWVIHPLVPRMTELSATEVGALAPFMVEVLKRLIFAVLSFMLAIAGADWLWQRQRFMARMRMTKEEMKEDYKQSEGDPHIKARQKMLRIERSRRRMMQAVPGATVVVMNPTHYAVALKYEAGETAAPMCVAKGLDSLALKIRAIAEEAGVTVIEDAPLARALYATVDIDEAIPPAHFEAVAKIIGFIMSSGRRVAAKTL